jgi:hypothetical protein
VQLPGSPAAAPFYPPPPLPNVQMTKINIFKPKTLPRSRQKQIRDIITSLAHP